MPAAAARWRPKADFLLEMTRMMEVDARGPEGEEASMRAWRLVPEPEMRMVSLVGGWGGIVRLCVKRGIYVRGMMNEELKKVVLMS